MEIKFYSLLTKWVIKISKEELENEKISTNNRFKAY